MQEDANTHINDDDEDEETMGYDCDDRPRLRRAMHRFKYTMEFHIQLPTQIQVERYRSDFTILNIDLENPSLLFRPNGFGVEYHDNQIRGMHGTSIEFDVDHTRPFRIIPHSPRAKDYCKTWLDQDGHTFHTLLKGLFGQMLLDSSVIPIETTTDSSSKNNDEPFENYITNASIERNVQSKWDGWYLETQCTPSFFTQEHTKLLQNLECSYRKLWSSNENIKSYAHLFDAKKTGPFFNSGEIFDVPIEISMVYTFMSHLQDSINSESNSNMIPLAMGLTSIKPGNLDETKETWRFRYQFSVSS